MRDILARHIVPACLLLAGAIHLLPVTGITGPQQLASLYGVPVADPNLEILLRHRAILFGLLGIFLVYAAFRGPARPAALLAGFTSVLSFLWVAWCVGDFNEQITRIATADLIALACLAVATCALLLRRQTGPQGAASRVID